jgi:hypothetical protein
LKPWKNPPAIWKNNKNGYWYIKVGTTVFSLHRFVYHNTKGLLPEDLDINHIDGDKDNNNPENLEVVTRSENIRHAYEIGLRVGSHTGKFGADHHRSRPIKGIHKDTGEVVSFGGLQEAGRGGFSPSKICLSAQGKRGHHKGFVWSYV